jgi:hypothetical protein
MLARSGPDDRHHPKARQRGPKFLAASHLSTQFTDVSLSIRPDALECQSICSGGTTGEIC